MHNYFLRLAYDGTNYHGWQWQKDVRPTVQGALEETLARIHKGDIILDGCGRTDAGVHASQYYAFLRTERPVPHRYLFIANKQLPKGIVLLDVFPVPEKSHARFDATERTYDFFLHLRPDAFLQRCSSLFILPDFAPEATPLVRALQALAGTHDFRAFCKTPDRHNTTICRMVAVKFYRNPVGAQYRFRFVANRFLRGMIRILVYDLMAVATGKMTVEVLQSMLKTGKRPAIIRQAPPEGLFLSGVRYPFADRAPELPTVHAGEWIEVAH